MKNLLAFFFIIFLSIFQIHAQKVTKSPIAKAMNYTCIIITGSFLEDTTLISQGSGVVVQVKKRYYIFTAFHVIEPAMTSQEINSILKINDATGYMYTTRQPLNSTSVLWYDKQMDIAILSLNTDNLQPLGPPKSRPSPVAPAYLEQIIDSIPIGDQVYMLGSRFFEDAEVFLPVVKQGIISAKVANHKIFGSTVYYVDNMANPGMSGGIVFNQKGEGLGLIIAYISKGNVSQDLTIVVPYYRIFQLLEKAVIIK